MAKQLILKALLSKPIHLEFTSEKTTSDGGLIFASAVVKNLDIHKRISDQIRDPRLASSVIHEQSEQIHQRILQLVAGYEDLNDAQTLRTDPALTSLVLDEKNSQKSKQELKQDFLSSPPSLCRLEKRLDRKGIEQLALLQVDLYLDRNKKRFEEIIKKNSSLTLQIDLDPTDLETHGQQPFAFYNGHYGHTAYLPLVIVDGENGDFITAIPRPGNRHATWFLRLILKKLFSRITIQYPGVKFKVRSDSGFQTEKYFYFLENHPQVQSATVSVAFNKSLEKLSHAAVLAFKHALDGSLDKSILHFGEFGYKAEAWRKFRRIVYQISHTSYGATEVRYYLSLDQTATPEAIKLDYNKRGDAENRIKEWKNQMFASRVSGDTFLVNAFRMLLSGFAFIILQEVQKKLQGTVFEKSYVQTIREKIIKIAGIIKISTRRILIVLPKSYPYQMIWEHLVLQTG